MDDDFDLAEEAMYAELDRPTKGWCTSDGVEVDFCDMKTSHLINCIKLMERRFWTTAGGNKGAAIKLAQHSDVEQKALAELVKRLYAQEVTLGDFFNGVVEDKALALAGKGFPGYVARKWSKG